MEQAVNVIKELFLADGLAGIRRQEMLQPLVGNGVAAFSFRFGRGGRGEQVGLLKLRCRSFRLVIEVKGGNTGSLPFQEPSSSQTKYRQ